MKKRLLLALACTATMACGLAVGCKKDTPQTLSVDIPSDATVEIGMSYTIEDVVGEYGGESVTPQITVTYDGQNVPVSSSSFTPSELGDYTITYTFAYGNEKSESFTQKVTCQDTTAPTVVLAEGKSIAYKVHSGDKITLSSDLFSVKDRSGETITATVSVYKGGTADESQLVQLDGENSFTAADAEGYLVVASAADSSGNVGTFTQKITLFAEGELEYFNNRDYLETQVLPGKNGGALEYVEDAEFVFEGTGAGKFTFNGGGYPMFIFNGLRASDFENCTELSLWVYNPAEYPYSFSVVSAAIEDGKFVDKATILPQVQVPQGRWMRVSVPGADIRNALAQQGIDTIGIFSSRDWLPSGDEATNAAYRESFVLYFDAFKIHTSQAAYSIDAEDMYVNLDEQADSTLLLPVSSLTGITDYAPLTAKIFDADGAEVAVVSASERGVEYAFTAEGSYTVYYLYKDAAGADGCTATQNIVVYSDATKQDYQDDYGLIDYDNKAKLDPSEYSIQAGKGNLSVENIDNNNVLTFESSSDSAWANLQFAAPVLGQLTAGDALRFKMYVDVNNSDATQYNLRVKRTNVDGETLIYGMDAIKTGEWLTVTISDVSQIIQDKVIWITIESIGASNYNWILRLDDIEVVKNLSMEVGSDLNTALAAAFPGATLGQEISVTDSAGGDYQLTDGKINQTGTYTATVTVSAEGFNARTIAVNVTVSEKILAKEGFDGTSTSLADYGVTVAGASTGSIVTEGTNRAVQIDNGTWDAYSFHEFRLAELMEVLQANPGATVRFRIRIARVDVAAGVVMNVRILALNEEKFLTQFPAAPYGDGYTFGDWVTVEITDPAVLAQIAQDGGFRVHVELVAPTEDIKISYWNYRAQLDDFEVVEG